MFQQELQYFVDNDNKKQLKQNEYVMQTTLSIT